MSRFFSPVDVKRSVGRAAPGILNVFALLIVASLVLPAAFAAPKDRVKGPKRRAAETETAPEDSGITSGGGADEKEDGKEGTAPLTLRDVIAFASERREALKDIKDYTAHFSKSERIGANLVQQEMEMKFRTKPFSVYFLYQSNKENGRQALFVNGKNNNNLLVKEAKGIAGAIGVIPLRLDDPKVKKENLYPVTEVGIANMLEATIKQWEHDQKVAGTEVEVKFFPNAKVKGIPCQAIQVTHLKKLKEIPYSVNRIYFDKETKLPIRGERYGWPRRAGEEAPLMEDYKYTNLKTNVNLTDADFSRAKYGF